MACIVTSFCACHVVLRPQVVCVTAGEHPTTQLCLRYLAGTRVGGRSVLDYGTGSGILAIAALKMGAASAMAVDMEQQAVNAALTNAALNHVDHSFQVARAHLHSICWLDISFVLSAREINFGQQISNFHTGCCLCD